ncbi:MAG: DUF3037 domain-containing protein [Rhodospirillales bacterium]|nr:DUF3037 domain-containing protein [Rhodospirillales bacterium]
MTQKQAYSYTVLRYVHDVVSGESLNVGVLMHAPKAEFLKVRTRKTVGRLKQAFPDLDRGAFAMSMRAVDRGFAAIAKQATKVTLLDEHADARSHALKVLPSDDSALQWSPVGTGLTADPAKTLERLYTRYVARYDLKSDKRRTDEDIWRPVRDKLTERGIDVPFETKAVVGTQDQIEFERAWKNGQWHAYEALSLDLADAEGIKVKARRWLGHLAAVHDGASEQIELHFLLGRPQDASLMNAYETAKAILRKVPFKAEVVDENDADELVTSIESELRTHSAISDSIPERPIVR